MIKERTLGIGREGITRYFPNYNKADKVYERLVVEEKERLRPKLNQHITSQGFKLEKAIKSFVKQTVKIKRFEKIYISGQISGLNYKEAFDKFEAAEGYIKCIYDCDIINPMKLKHGQNIEIGDNVDTLWQKYMLKDIEELFKCDAIFMISNWLKSKGARIEYKIAEEMSKVIIHQGSTLFSYEDLI